MSTELTAIIARLEKLRNFPVVEFEEIRDELEALTDEPSEAVQEVLEYLEDLIGSLNDAESRFNDLIATLTAELAT